MSNKYIGITLGPIQNTLELCSTPAGLWAASYLFSKMAGEICQELVKSGIREEQFLVPYFELEQGTLNLCLPKDENVDLTALMKKGIGFFHDRIIYQVEAEEQDPMSKARLSIEKVTDNICESILKQLKVEETLRNREKQNLQKYFQIYMVCMEASDGSPVLSVASALDHLETESSFWISTKRDYLWEILSDNDRVKKSWMAEGLVDWQLIEDRQKEIIINIPEMAKRNPAPTEENKKKHAYFALVQADGDRMGKVLGSLKTTEDIRRFSKKCLLYTARCAERILEYGGIVIYAGGDDLLFLAPVESYQVWSGETEARKKNILELLEELRDIFMREGFEIAGSTDERPTLSVGLTIQYNKFPLYEALKNGGSLLFQEAKGGGRDSLAVRLRKHSGKSADFIIRSFSNTNQVSAIVAVANGEKSAELLASIFRHMSAYETVFRVAIGKKKKELLENVFANLLEADGEIEKPDFRNRDGLVNLLWAVMERCSIEEEHESGEKEYSSEEEKLSEHIKKREAIYISMLRFMKFFGEDGEEKMDEDN